MGYERGVEDSFKIISIGEPTLLCFKKGNLRSKILTFSQFSIQFIVVKALFEFLSFIFSQLAF